MKKFGKLAGQMFSRGDVAYRQCNITRKMNQADLKVRWPKIMASRAPIV